MEEIMSQLWRNYIIAIVIIISILVIVFMTKISKHKKKCKQIIQMNPPQTVILKDIIIYENKTSNKILVPVLKNSFTNRVYVPTAMGNYGNLLTPYTFITNKPPKISIINFKNQPVEFTKKGRLFIEEECGKIRVNNKKITIENIEYEYVGKLVNINNFQLSNINETNILEELDGAILYKGIVDFDDEGFIEDYYC